VIDMTNEVLRIISRVDFALNELGEEIPLKEYGGNRDFPIVPFTFHV